MNPMVLASLLSFAPGLLSGLFGDPQAKLRKQLMQLSSPAYQGRLTQQNYQQALGSPAYAQGQQAITAGARTTS